MKNSLALFLSCIGIISTVNIKAQIVYTDIPDTTISYPTIEYLGAETNILDIDLNNDSIIDFYFTLHKQQDWETPSSQPISYESNIECIQDNKTIFYLNNYDDAPCTDVLDYNDLIDQNSSWTPYNSSFIYLETWYHGINCNLPFQDKYYGLKFKIGSNIHYGWLLADVNEMGEIVLKGYAYNSIPNQSIKAGQTGPNMIDYTAVSAPFIIYSKNKIVTIKQINNNEIIRQVLIYNISGTIISESMVNDFQISIDLSATKYGIYVVKVVCDKHIFSKLLPIY